MAIYADKRDGKPTGSLVVEVYVNGRSIKRRVVGQKAARRLEAELRAGMVEVTPNRGTVKTLRSLGDLPRAAAELWAGQKDANQSRRRLEVACELIGIHVPLRTFSTTHVDLLRQSLRERKVADPTINRYSVSLHKAIQWAYKRGYVERMPDFMWFKEPEKKFSWLREDDERRLVAWLRGQGEVGERVAIMVQVLVATGMRVGELLSLDACDINQECGEITIHGDKAKGGEPRTQPVPEALGASLAAIIEEGYLPTKRQLDRLLGLAKAALGLDPKLTVHSLRHTTATRLAGAGVNQRVIQVYMGHKRIETTNRYTHVGDERKRAALGKLYEVRG